MKRVSNQPLGGLLGFVFYSKAAILIIAANCFIYWRINHLVGDINVLDAFILSPANLLKGNYFSLLTSGFIHKNIQHLALNMLGVFVFARIVERRMGFLKTMVIYFGALLISMTSSLIIYVLILHKNIAIIGASGAVMGLVSAAMLLEPFCITFEMILPFPVMVKGWMFFYADLVGFLGGESDGISHLAHLMGFLSIGILTYFFSSQEKRKLRAGLTINIVSFVVFVLLSQWFIANRPF